MTTERNEAPCKIAVLTDGRWEANTSLHTRREVNSAVSEMIRGGLRRSEIFIRRTTWAKFLAELRRRNARLVTIGPKVHEPQPVEMIRLWG